VATAREQLRVWENPWQQYGYFLFIAAMLLNLLNMTTTGNASAGILYVFLPVLSAMALYYPLKRCRVLPRAHRAIEANKELAADAPRRRAEAPDRRERIYSLY
jgi:L-asparagine transporter-like permease